MRKSSNKKPKVNPNSILILYEGETEAEFYKRLLKILHFVKAIRINYANLHGVSNITKKVTDKINSYLAYREYESLNAIYVFVAYDRDGPREKEALLDIEALRLSYVYKGSRIKQVYEVVATWDLESWFFHDLDGIYTFLKVPTSKRNHNKYRNIELVNHKTLSALFHRHKKHYQKGKKVEGFLEYLDIQKIYNSVDELQVSIAKMKELI